MDILVTNNPMARRNYENKLRIEYSDDGFIDVLIRVRDFVHEGHLLLSHPLSGSVKPNETLYKSVLVSGTRGEIDAQSEKIIGQCVLAAQKFSPREIPESYRKDLQAVDYLLISEAIRR